MKNNRKLKAEIMKNQSLWRQAIKDFCPYSGKLSIYELKEVFHLLPLDKLKKTIDHP